MSRVFDRMDEIIGLELERFYLRGYQAGVHNERLRVTHTPERSWRNT